MECKLTVCACVCVCVRVLFPWLLLAVWCCLVSRLLYHRIDLVLVLHPQIVRRLIGPETLPLE